MRKTRKRKTRKLRRSYKRTSKQSGGVNMAHIKQIMEKRIHAAELANVSRNVSQRLRNKLSMK